MSDTDTISDTDLEAMLGDPEEQNPDAVAHIIRRQPPMNAHETADWHRANGTEATGLCGHKWVPRFGVAPDQLDACNTCIRIYNAMGGA